LLAKKSEHRHNNESSMFCVGAMPRSVAANPSPTIAGLQHVQVLGTMQRALDWPMSGQVIRAGLLQRLLRVTYKEYLVTLRRSLCITYKKYLVVTNKKYLGYQLRVTYKKYLHQVDVHMPPAEQNRPAPIKMVSGCGAWEYGSKTTG
jgi:hypothetical protein